MISSHYNFFLDLFHSKGYGVIYNTNSGSIVSIRDYNTWNFLRGNNTLNISVEDAKLLEENKILVHSHQEELSAIEARYERRVKDSDTLYLTIMPTESCNFSCPYCFLWEKAPKFMSDDTYADILRYILEMCSSTTQIQRIMINWFGGEPTLCVSKICSFMSKLASIAREKHLAVESSITTNGYLLTKDNFLKLLEAGVYYYQVTVDGMQETHNIGRPHKTDPDSYTTIMHNLEEIKTLELPYRLDIRSNFTQSTIPSVNSFIEIFSQEFGTDERFQLYCRPVYDYDTKENSIEILRGDILSIDDGITQQNVFADKIAKLTQNTTIRRMVDPLPQPTACWCNAETSHHIVIGPDGSIYICDTLTGSDNSLGKLVKGAILWNRNDVVSYDIFHDSRTAKCMNCKLLPICMGGCLRNRIHSESQCYWTEQVLQNALAKYYS